MQPYTTDQTTQGRLVAENALRLKLWADDAFAHRWLCHADGGECDGGATCSTPQNRKAFYESDLETP